MPRSRFLPHDASMSSRNVFDYASTQLFELLQTVHAHLFVDQAHIHPRATAMGLGGQLQDINHLYSTKGKATIEIVSVTAAAVSVLACLISLYWFLLLQRNFRRTYV